MGMFQVVRLGLLGLLLGPGVGAAQEEAGRKFCTETANAALQACQFEIRDDRSIADGTCLNISDADERAACYANERKELNDAKEQCQDQFEARLDVCDLLGEDRYDPDFTPSNFLDPQSIGAAVRPNPYFPLVPGTRWVYETEDEIITVMVTEKTKLIDGVTCVVVTDMVEVDGRVVEFTEDWFAQDIKGNVWYCGEVSQEFETFRGDKPREPELVELEGSWKAGRERDQAGIIMLADPRVGDAYRQEFSLGNAEDVAEVTSTSGRETAPAASCRGRCIVTRDFTPLEPGVEESKYYASDVGLILEVDGEGNRVELVEFTVP